MMRKPLGPKSIEIERVSKVYRRPEVRSALTYELLRRNLGGQRKTNER